MDDIPNTNDGKVDFFVFEVEFPGEHPNEDGEEEHQQAEVENEPGVLYHVLAAVQSGLEQDVEQNAASEDEFH